MRHISWDRSTLSAPEVRELPLRARTDYLLRRFRLRPRKSLGQNFLVNEGAAQRLAQTAVAAGLPMVEIGGGLGALTVPLVESGQPLKVVEIDAALAQVLGWLTGDLPHVEVILGDFLELAPERLWPEPAVAVGNLPYLSASAILQRLWEPRAANALSIAMMQREVADRLRATTGTKAYGPLSVLARAHLSEIAVLAQLGPGSFVPAPEVRATALKMLPCPDGPPDMELLDLALRGAFSGRRKTLLNSLKMSKNWDKETTEEVLRKAGLDGQRRGETLELAELLALGRAMARHEKN